MIKKTSATNINDNIDVSSFPSNVLLQEIWPVTGISFSKSNNYQLKKSLKQLLSLLNRIFFLIKLKFY